MQHLVYASSSPVYGGNKKVPFSTVGCIHAVWNGPITVALGGAGLRAFAEWYKITAEMPMTKITVVVHGNITV